MNKVLLSLVDNFASDSLFIIKFIDQQKGGVFYVLVNEILK